MKIERQHEIKVSSSSIFERERLTAHNTVKTFSLSFKKINENDEKK